MRLRPAVVLCLLAAACGRTPVGGGESSGVSGLPATKPLRQLSAAEQTTICDWTARQYGGYGQTTKCPSGKIATRVPRTLESCQTSFTRLRCDVTVGQFEACTLAAARDVCASVTTQPPACKVEGCP